ncbi:unnamed protein product [Arctogadus glacialis]
MPRRAVERDALELSGRSSALAVTPPALSPPPSGAGGCGGHGGAPCQVGRRPLDRRPIARTVPTLALQCIFNGSLSLCALFTPVAQRPFPSHADTPLSLPRSSFQSIKVTSRDYRKGHPLLEAWSEQGVRWRGCAVLYTLAKQAL